MSWKNTEGKKNDCRIRASCMCGSISHSCRSGGHRVPLQGPQPQGSPCLLTELSSTELSAAAETPMSLVLTPSSTLGSPAVAHGCSSSLFSFTCACALPAGSHSSPCIPAPLSRGAQGSEAQPAAPASPSDAQGMRRALQCLPFPARYRGKKYLFALDYLVHCSVCFPLLFQLPCTGFFGGNL